MRSLFTLFIRANSLRRATSNQSEEERKERGSRNDEVLREELEETLLLRLTHRGREPIIAVASITIYNNTKPLDINMI